MVSISSLAWRKRIRACLPSKDNAPFQNLLSSATVTVLANLPHQPNGTRRGTDPAGFSEQELIQVRFVFITSRLTSGEQLISPSRERENATSAYERKAYEYEIKYQAEPRL